MCVTCYAVASCGVVVALAGLAGGFVEPVVAVTAPVTLEVRHANLALAFPIAAERNKL